jgi:hypothetical protein
VFGSPVQQAFQFVVRSEIRRLAVSAAENGASAPKQLPEITTVCVFVAANAVAAEIVGGHVGVTAADGLKHGPTRPSIATNAGAKSNRPRLAGENLVLGDTGSDTTAQRSPRGRCESTLGCS